VWNPAGVGQSLKKKNHILSFRLDAIPFTETKFPIATAFSKLFFFPSHGIARQEDHLLRLDCHEEIGLEQTWFGAFEERKSQDRPLASSMAL